MDIENDEYGKFAEYYDYTVPYGLRGDVKFYVDLAKETDGEILEIGCGTGRILIPTARAGKKITGLDTSPGMLARLQQNLQRESVAVQENITLALGDMRDFNLSKKFALITTPFRPFQHIETVEDQLRTLRCVYDHLETGGRFVLDLFNPSLPALVDELRFDIYMSEPEFTLPNGDRVIRSHRVLKRDHATQSQLCEIIFTVRKPDQTKEQYSQQFIMRHLFRFEAEHLLERAGFEVEAVYSDYDRAPFGTKYPGELILVSRKR